MAGGRDVGLLSSLAEQSSAGQTKSLISSSLAKHSFARQPNTKYSASLANVKHSRDRRSFTPPCLAKHSFARLVELRSTLSRRTSLRNRLKSVAFSYIFRRIFNSAR